MANQKRLIVLVRGWGNDTDFLLRLRKDAGGDFSEEFLERLQTENPDAVLRLAFPRESKARGDPRFDALSTADPQTLADEIVDRIDTFVREDQYSSITLVSYSTGSLLTRAAIASIHGIPISEKNIPERKPWANKITRWVSLAGILRGWSITSATSIAGRIFGRPAILALKIARFWDTNGSKELLLASVERGMPFVVNSRLRQIELEKNSADDKTIELPLFINLLGAADDIVSPADCLEPSPSTNELFWEVPGTGHLEMLDIVGPSSQRRARIVTEAIFGADQDVRKEHSWTVVHDDLNDFFDEFDRPVDASSMSSITKVEHAVIVMHGIRDHGFWTKRIGRKIKKLGGRAFNRAPSPGYGYFSVLDFLSVWRRKKQARWFLEQYADIRSCFRGAKISFVGHSNGTYLLKSALDTSPQMRLHNVYLAGSVLRTDLEWPKYLDRIDGKVLNVRANRDWVVGMLPFAMQKLGLKFLDVGGAGYAGFNARLLGDKFVEVKIDGLHNAGISEGSWDMITEFVMNDTFPTFDDAPTDKTMQKRVTIAPGLLIAVVPIFFLVVDLISLGLSTLFRPFPSFVQSIFPWETNGLTIQVGFVILTLMLIRRVARLF